MVQKTKIEWTDMSIILAIQIIIAVGWLHNRFKMPLSIVGNRTDIELFEDGSIF